MGGKGKNNSGGQKKALSMTGFGRGSFRSSSILLDAEIRSLNSRFLDCTFKLPRPYLQFESVIRDLVKQKVSRGRVEVYVTRSPIAEESSGLQLNRGLFEGYLSQYKTLITETGGNFEASREKVVRDILSRREVLVPSEESGNVDGELSGLEKAVDEALDALCVMRQNEGSMLLAEILLLLDSVRNFQKQISSAAKTAPQVVRDRLLERLRSLAPDVQLDASRMATEAALLADRVDVREELVRIETHCQYAEEALASSPNGRKLDFLMQELSREFTTIGAKAQDGAVQGIVIDAKSVLEKLKEQIANVE